MLAIDVVNTFAPSNNDRLSYAAQQREAGNRKESIQFLISDLNLRDEDFFEDEFLLR